MLTDVQKFRRVQSKVRKFSLMGCNEDINIATAVEIHCNKVEEVDYQINCFNVHRLRNYRL